MASAGDSHELLHEPRGGSAEEARVSGLAAHERESLLAWLDDGLRGGRRGRLEAEYPTALDPARIGDHCVVRSGSGFAAHALARPCTLRVGPRRLPAGLIGLVYTDPARRGRGLARRCVEAALESLRARGAWLALLWSDLDGLYTRLGFQRAGLEWSYRVDAAACRRALGKRGAGVRVTSPGPEDWPALESLYAAKPSGALRTPGELERLAGAPDCQVCVAREGETPVAYAALGRGDDLSGVVHEWAGDPAGVLACLAQLLEGREAVSWLVGPEEEPPAPELRAAGATRLAGDFAWVRILDPGALWERVREEEPELHPWQLRIAGAELMLVGPPGRIWLTLGELTALLFGPRRPSPRGARAEQLPKGRGLPWPMFLWGFDSV